MEVIGAIDYGGGGMFSALKFYPTVPFGGGAARVPLSERLLSEMRHHGNGC